MSIFGKEKESESRKDISRLREYLKKATEAGFIEWTPVSEKVVSRLKGQKALLPSGKAIEIIVLSNSRGEPVYGLSIEDGNEKREIKFQRSEKQFLKELFFCNYILECQTSRNEV